MGEEATVAVTVRSVSVRPMRNRRQKRVEARVMDETGPMVAVWFNQPWLARQLSEGTALLLHGLDFPTDLFSPTFAIARTAGWIAHCFEELDNGRLIRPKSEYVGVRRHWKTAG